MSLEVPPTPPTTPEQSGTPAGQPTCFVVIGFGLKTDYATGRVLDLDKTYEQLIRPAFDEVNVNCFRAIDANRTGGIDRVMYHWLYDADIVVADLSTLNANVFYELGVRHAQKPNTTLIIAESVLMQKIPFDLSHFVIHTYQHGGTEISEAERKRFVGKFSGVVKDLLAAEKKRQSETPEKPPQHDSPVFAGLPEMIGPRYESKTSMPAPLFVPPNLRAEPTKSDGKQLAGIIDAAEKAKSGYTVGEGEAKKKVPADFALALELFQKAIDQIESEQPADPAQPRKKPDPFLVQRLALVTYKHAEKQYEAKKISREEAEAQMLKAEAILEKYCAPKISTDPETLGLSGAIQKRLFKLMGQGRYLDGAIHFYERGFYVKQDYYNGINVAFMYTQRANILLHEGKNFDAIVSYGHGNIIREKVAKICLELRQDQTAFGQRGDQVWVLMSEAEAYRGRGETDMLAQLEAKIKAIPPKPFETDAYDSQQNALIEEMAAFEKANPFKTGAATLPDRSTTVPASVTSPRVTESGAITVDANLDRTRPIKSIKVNCKIEYSDAPARP